MQSANARDEDPESRDSGNGSPAARPRRTRAALEESESFLGSVVDNLPVIVYRKDLEGRLIYANRLYCERRGKPLADLLGKTDFDLSGEELGRQYWADNVRVMETRRPLDKVELQIKPDGEPSWIRIIKVPILDAAGRVVGTQGMYWDVTERRRAEEALRWSEQRFREMAETIRDAFWISGPDRRRFLYVSPACEQIWGIGAAGLCDQAEGGVESVAEEDRERALAAFDRLAGGSDYRVVYRLRRPDGSIRWVEDRGYPVRDADGSVDRAVGVIADITERKELEAELLHSQKMDAVGQLAGGVAHDFNNMLTIINGFARLLLDSDLPPEAQDGLRQIYVAGEKAVGLVRQLMLFSRKHPVQIDLLNLNDVVASTGKMLRHLIGEHIELELKPAPDLPPIEADLTMIEQLLVNLAVNARDAMPKGGRLAIVTEAETLSEEDARRHPGARAGNFVRMSVADTGCGIPPEVLPKIFEPFFTTKEAGKGTGLGLATVFAVVRQHHGWIEVDSRVGAGTSFAVHLPVAARSARPTKSAEADANPAGGDETVLLVEDEPSVRDFAAAVLQRYGYRVLRAASGAEALETWKWHGPRIALLLTDLVLPNDMTGLDLAGRLLAEKPALKVLCASGYTGDTLPPGFSMPERIRFIHKPYQPRALAKAVRESLDPGRPAPPPSFAG